MPTFSAPLINLYSRDLPRAVAFYSQLGFVQTFRTPASGEPSHIQLEIVLWTDDTDAAVNALVAMGAPLLSPAHDFLDGKLRAAWVADPDGNPIQLVQRRR